METVTLKDQDLQPLMVDSHDNRLVKKSLGTQFDTDVELFDVMTST